MQADFTALAQLVDEIGEQMSDLDAVVRDAESSWALRFSTGQVVHLAQRENPPRLEMMLRVASVPSECPAEVLKMAMMFNFLSDESGGARFGLCAPGDVIYLIHDSPEAEWTFSALQARLRGLVSLADHWGEFFSRALGAEPVQQSASAIPQFA